MDVTSLSGENRPMEAGKWSWTQAARNQPVRQTAASFLQGNKLKSRRVRRCGEYCMPVYITKSAHITSVAYREQPAVTRLCESQFRALPPYSGELLTSRHVFDSQHIPFRSSPGGPFGTHASNPCSAGRCYGPHSILASWGAGA